MPSVKIEKLREKVAEQAGQIAQAQAKLEQVRKQIATYAEEQNKLVVALSSLEYSKQILKALIEEAEKAPGTKDAEDKKIIPDKKKK